MRGNAGTFTVLAVLGGCGLEEDEFVPRYANLYCDYYMSCADPAQRVFDGLDTQEACLARYGPDVQRDGEGCKLVRSEARACLEAMERLTCPADPAELDAALPPPCGDSWKKCIASEGDVNGDNDDPTP